MSRRRRAFIVLPLAAWIASSFWIGRGGRVQLDRNTFSLHLQREYVLPGSDLTVWRSGDEQLANQLLDRLRADGYVNITHPSDDAPVTIARFNGLWRDGHTMLYREIVRDRVQWNQWTDANPELARVVWPRVAAEVREGQIGVAANTLFHAKSSQDVAAFERSIAADPDLPF